MFVIWNYTQRLHRFGTNEMLCARGRQGSTNCRENNNKTKKQSIDGPEQVIRQVLLNQIL